MKIVITTGIFPPQIGGPAQYAKNIAEAFRAKGHRIVVLTYQLEKYLPTGIRHFLFFLRSVIGFVSADFIIALDTFSVGWPSVVAAKILGKKIVIRIGGDFLWEEYVERTGDLVLLRDFYTSGFSKLSLKEKLIFHITRSTLERADYLAFSTDWQRKIWLSPYHLHEERTGIVENYYGEKVRGENPKEKNFLAFTRPLKWKNLTRLDDAFLRAKEKVPEIILDREMISYDESIQKMKQCYAVILVSLGDISPNMILDALRCNRPFILTRETGLYEKLKDVALFVDPENEEDITEKILFLTKSENYELYRKKVEGFIFTHSWSEISHELLAIYENS